MLGPRLRALAAAELTSLLRDSTNDEPVAGGDAAPASAADDDGFTDLLAGLDDLLKGDH
ncbi:hypothetical protein GII33_13950 [Gordonia pseudamarae]|jgi:hypothetical protein|uniref:Uncharacterized protein n=1 Tax=Gordonia pseudamarae TaxID=2831662 RepID=A0ABX6IKE0_9ACTN|nr:MULTISPECIES: hypothetical protein [Gordonia]MBD0024608.1 hypothetical protein [Gordonia sp. (in: high G+C Gram-positive bacteria)]QHN26890.1 hypothetical protein GII33_13950 [Gordonia pseudamarae]QHN35780.1 hypothetical protein GII31_13775 [Gordonia pseudamarae]